jgi:WD40 repeat protein
VRSIWWSPDDAMVVTAGMDGAVYEWQLRDFKRERENVNKGCGYSCVAGATDSNSIFAVGSDKKLKELDDAQVIKVGRLLFLPFLVLLFKVPRNQDAAFF